MPINNPIQQRSDIVGASNARKATEKAEGKAGISETGGGGVSVRLKSKLLTHYTTQIFYCQMGQRG